jgi:hypothetical protein
MSMSIDSASAVDASGAVGGSGLAWPFSLTLVKQLFAVVHAGRPYWLRYAVRSLSALGSSNAPMIATVAPLPWVEAADVRL